MVGSAVGKAWGMVSCAANVVGGPVGAVHGDEPAVGWSLGLCDVVMGVGSLVGADIG